MRLTNEDFAFVHATKTLFDKNKGEIIYIAHNHLFLNWVDSADSKYFDGNTQGVNVFIATMDFIDEWVGKRKVFIHCDAGASRSPSIAMVYLAKRKHAISNQDHVFAEREFTDIYPKYFAGKGISDFLFKNWFKIK